MSVKAVRVSSTAREAMEHYATRRGVKETGGILLGWHTDDEIIVRDALQVDDQWATGGTYTRDEDRANAVLEKALDNYTPGDPTGYVGEWHSHPKPYGPSQQDHATGNYLTALAGRSIAMVVIISDSDGWAFSSWSTDPTKARGVGMP